MEAIASPQVDPSEVVVDCSGYSLTKSSFMRLQPGRWLNDECINAHISLVNENHSS